MSLIKDRTEIIDTIKLVFVLLCMVAIFASCVVWVFNNKTDGEAVREQQIADCVLQARNAFGHAAKYTSAYREFCTNQLN